MRKVEILLKEYDTLRAEILTAMSNRNAILTYGLATIGILYTGTAALNQFYLNSIVPVIILMIVAPVLCAFIAMNWLGEYERMQRAGKFIAGLEKKIKDEYGNVVLTWETTLRNDRKHMNYPYHSTIIFLTIISVFSYFFGLYFYKTTTEITIVFSIVGILIFSSFHIYLSRKLGRCCNNAQSDTISTAPSDNNGANTANTQN